MKKMRTHQFDETSNEKAMEIDNNIPVKIVSSWPDKSYILTGADGETIHAENVRKIQSMSEKEILEERNKLLATMDPAIVAFLKSRRKKLKIEETAMPSISNLNQAGRDINVEDIEAPVQLLSQPESEKWIHFDVIETNKLAWMKDVITCKSNEKKQYEARYLISLNCF